MFSYFAVCDVFWQSTYTYVGSYTKLHAPNEPPTVIVVSTSVSDFSLPFDNNVQVQIDL